MEKQYFFSDSPELFGMLYYPCGEVSGATLIVHSFGEEKKSAQRVMVDIAQTLSSNGEWVLLFDLRGCGDSQGDMSDAHITGWIDDIQNAIDFLKYHSGFREVSLVGLRFGAYLISHHNLLHTITKKRIVFIEPVLNASRYLKELLRDKQMKELLTKGSLNSKRNDLINRLESGTTIDLNGYPVTGRMYMEMKEYDGKDNLSPLLLGTTPLHIIPVDPFHNLNKRHHVFLDRENVSLQLIKSEPFWLQIDNTDDVPLLNCITGIYSYGK